MEQNKIHSFFKFYFVPNRTNSYNTYDKQGLYRVCVCVLKKNRRELKCFFYSFKNSILFEVKWILSRGFCAFPRLKFIYPETKIELSFFSDFLKIYSRMRGTKQVITKSYSEKR